MNNTIQVYDRDQRTIDIEPILEAYRLASGFYTVPHLATIYNQYNDFYMIRKAELQATIYNDEIYDASPYPQPRELLPDSIVGEMDERIGMRQLEIEEIQEFLDRFRMFYEYQNMLFNPPVVEVW